MPEVTKTCIKYQAKALIREGGHLPQHSRLVLNHCCKQTCAANHTITGAASLYTSIHVCSAIKSNQIRTTLIAKTTYPSSRSTCSHHPSRENSSLPICICPAPQSPPKRQLRRTHRPLLHSLTSHMMRCNKRPPPPSRFPPKQKKNSSPGGVKTTRSGRFARRR